MTNDILMLQTGLFGETADLLAAVDSIDGITSHLIDLQPEQMDDKEWDEVIRRILSAKTVITL